LKQAKRKPWFIWISRRGLAKLLLAAVATVLLAVLFSSDYTVTNTWYHWTMPLT